ncbi:MAG: tRNA dihydrouridine synthase DusB [Hyphomicrobiaceae bacterium]|nr:tRNA dihydrouridine synthase DusB [Hyphomicrobiaceae bacterium]
MSGATSTPAVPSSEPSRQVGACVRLRSGFRIGSIEPANPVVLAPMSGVSDLPFRRLAARMGAGLVVSEMVASRELAAERRDVVRKAAGRELDPFVIQLVGHDPDWMREGARIAEGLGAKIIDINMGCPSREVTGRLSGSALMRDLDHAEKIITAVIAAVRVPVTLKMRLGWDGTSLNAPHLARRAEAAGVKLLTVHGRTRCQFFKGVADWSQVKAVVDAVAIPVVVNGDITSAETAREALAQSGAAGVMIGRGAYGAPWLPGQIADALAGRPLGVVAMSERALIASEHIEEMLSHYGAALGLKNARKHVGWYLETAGTSGDELKAWRRELCTQDDPRALLAGLKTFFATRDVGAAA